MSAFQPSTDRARDVAVERCEVCIVGAGIAGLNALFVASQYLSRDQKVILIDRRERVGGMWVDTYPYVRLNQPHPMFTAGNIEWSLGRDRSYLATKNEVLDHFEHCLNVIKQRVQIDEFYGWAVESHDEANGIVRIGCTAFDAARWYTPNADGRQTSPAADRPSCRVARRGSNASHSASQSGTRRQHSPELLEHPFRVTLCRRHSRRASSAP
jgi:monoamine oxidase